MILWLDHRASKEAEQINQSKHEILKYVGGKVSLEMEIPKLLWLKNNSKHWNNYGLFFDLPDFLTWKATGSESRSLCSLICKWNYEINNWNFRFFQDIGLNGLSEAQIGSQVLPPGTPVGRGLTQEVACELGLRTGTPVGTSIIDAHAGGLGLIGCQVSGVSSGFDTRLSI